MRFIVLLSIALVFEACSVPEKPVFEKLENVKFNSLSIKKPYSVTLNADAVFNNPNALGAEITAMDFDVYINGAKTTHVKQDVTIKIRAQSEFILPIICTIPLEDVFQDLRLTDFFKSKRIEYKMVGHLTLDVQGIGVNVPFSYEGEENLGL